MLKPPTPKPGMTFDEACAWLRANDELAQSDAQPVADVVKPTEPTTPEKEN